MEQETDEIPDWAMQEREGDLGWIRENLHIFWPAAQVGYESVGRGAIVVDMITRPDGQEYPFGYLDQAAIELGGDEEIQRLVSEYEPREEFVTTLLKTEQRTSSYRLKMMAEEQRELLGNRSDFGQQEPTEVLLEPPSIEQLMQWEWEGCCEAACEFGCVVEPDGTCEHGKPSWLLEMGLI
ncbi:MAG: hypothetical protein FOGNACKC_02882 [Anaerolineae bacterium]|nr:hypothetical protein [Anaerolineae bacterium]